jgi:predicted amidohydrolase YtcJ
MRLAPGLLLLAGAACSGPAGSAPDLVLLGGKVFTADSTKPWAEAIAIRGDRIVAVGAAADVRALIGAPTRVIELGGRVAVPGFNDAHDHLGPSLTDREIVMDANPIPDPAFALVRAAVSRSPAGTWLGVFIGPAVLSDPAARRAALDVVAPEHPVVLQAWTGHGLILNSAALTATGLDDRAEDPLGGRLERDGAGRLTGLLEEYADFCGWRRLAARYPDSVLVAALRNRAEAAVAMGITSIQNMTTALDPAKIPALLQAAAMPVRLRMIPMPLTTVRGRELSEWDQLRKSTIPGTTVSGMKWILDGTPVERLAVLRAPYADRAGWYGRLDFPPDTLRALLREAVEHHQQPILHMVGDSAISLALHLMTEVVPDSVWHRLRPRIEHGEGLMPDLVPLARRLGVIVVQNPTHLALGPMFLARYGAERAGKTQLLRSLLAAGIPLAFGSDGPQNPFLNIMLAVLHPDNPPEAITVEQAVTAYTFGSAYAEGQETEKGSLAVGKLADLAVLSQDIFTVPLPQLPATASVLTLVGGRIRYDAGLLAGTTPAKPRGR